MKQRLIITEKQYNRVIGRLSRLVETSEYNVMLGQVLADLDKNYEMVNGIRRGHDDYYESPSVRVKADDSVISPKQLLTYLKKKYQGKCGGEFLKQVISDWSDGTINRKGNLSSNVGLYE